MKTEQFDHLQCICTLDGLCYSLYNVTSELSNDAPEEIIEAVWILRGCLQSFREKIGDYVIAHKDIYIDKNEV